MRHSRPISHRRRSRAVLVALAALVALYGIAGFPSPEEAADELRAVIDFDISPAAAHPQRTCISMFWGQPLVPPRCFDVQHTHPPPTTTKPPTPTTTKPPAPTTTKPPAPVGCTAGQHKHHVLGCHSVSACHGSQHNHDGRGCHARNTKHTTTTPTSPTNRDGDNQNNDPDDKQKDCGINADWDGKKCVIQSGDPSRCTGETTYDPTSRLCINTSGRDDPDVTTPIDYCSSPYEFHDGTECRVKQRGDDPERSRHCPAGQVFYSTLGCRCPGGAPNCGGDGGNPDPNPGGDGGNPDPNPGPNPGPDPDPVCSTGLTLPVGERDGFRAELGWETLVDIRPTGPPGEVWPPHPGVPGGSEYLVVAESPVWTVIDPAAAPWAVAAADGCVWTVTGVRVVVTQLLPWLPGDRTVIENAAAARPAAGFDTYLQRWDRLSATQQSQAEQFHRGGDVSHSCDFADAQDPALAKASCAWELPWAGVWSWTVRACFEGTGQGQTYRECPVLDNGVEWFLRILDYTQQITLHADESAGG